MVSAWRNVQKKYCCIFTYDNWSFEPQILSIFHFDWASDSRMAHILGIKQKSSLKSNSSAFLILEKLQFFEFTNFWFKNSKFKYFFVSFLGVYKRADSLSLLNSYFCQKKRPSKQPGQFKKIINYELLELCFFQIFMVKNLFFDFFYMVASAINLLFTWTSGWTNSPFSINIFSISVYFCWTPTTTSIIVIDAAVVFYTRPNKGENTFLVGVGIVIISLSIVIISSWATACIGTCKFFVSLH